MKAKHFLAVFILSIFAVSFGERIALANEQEFYNLRLHMSYTEDKVEGIKWIGDKSTPNLIAGDTCCIYLAQKDDLLWIRWLIGFSGDKWIFFRKIAFNIDGYRTSIDISSFEHKSDHEWLTVWEYVDLAGEAHIDTLKRIAKSRETIIRFRGDQYQRDFVVPKKTKDAMRRVLRLYELMQ